MVRKIFLISLVAAMTSALPLSSIVVAQDKGYPDVSVMNGILEDLIKPGNRNDFDGGDVSGSYLPGYGLLFVVNAPNGFSSSGFLAEKIALDTKIRVYSAIDSNLSIVRPRIASGRLDSVSRTLETLTKKEEESQKHRAELIEKGVMKFLESYADAENKLSPDERISVITLFDDESQTGMKIYIASKKSISDFRNGSMDESAFRRSMEINNLNQEEDESSIGIMATILEKSVATRRSKRGFPMLDADSRGVYLKGLGTFFICSVSNLQYSLSFDESEDTTKVSDAKIRRRIVNAIGTYGESLRMLQKGESVCVLLKVNSFGGADENILVSVRKDDIDKYSRSEIDLEALLRSATIVENQ